MDLKGLATGIGSVPFIDADQAVERIFASLPDAPFWPQLPKRDFREGMVAQYTEQIPGLKATQEGIIFDRNAADTQLEAFYERIIAGDHQHFRISRDFAAGFYSYVGQLEDGGAQRARLLKGHVTGPLTFAAGILDEQGVSLLHDDVYMQVIIKGLVMKAQWQTASLRSFGRPMLIFFDEPYMGSFGSAFTPLDRPKALATLGEFAEGIKQPDVLVGVHCCGNTDWSIFCEIPAIDVINFDAFSYLDTFVIYAKPLQQFLARGGFICWGAVPTQEFGPGVTRQSLIERVQRGIDMLAARGVDRDLLGRQLLLSPSCGLGTLKPDKAEAILAALADLSSHFKA